MIKRKIKILFTAAEAEPFVKIGGLGDYAGSLPLKLQQHLPQIDIRLAIPFHGCIATDISKLSQIKTIKFDFGGKQKKAEIFQTRLDGLCVYLIRPIPPYDDPAVYYTNSEKNGQKYAFFSLACLEMLKAIKWQPDVIHANDWHTSYLVLKLNRLRANEDIYKPIKTLLTIHNLGYMGGDNSKLLVKLGLETGIPIKELPAWAIHQPLPLGLASADQISTVSPTYSKEILTHEFGYGLEKILQKRSKSLTGILNGINQTKWDPATDNKIAAQFSVEKLEIRCENKFYLQEFLNLEKDINTPLLGVISRMDIQKGIDLIISAIPLLTHHSWQLVILGSGSHDIEQACMQLEKKYPQRVRVVLRFDEMLACQIYAGADMLLIPSRYEPCGTTQMIAMRYGCIPIARATGGLRDTIIHEVNGYLFKDSSANSLAQILAKAIHCNHSKPKEWRDMQYSAMKSDFSWEQSAQKYADLYFQMIS
jgi:starch synthase